MVHHRGVTAGPPQVNPRGRIAASSLTPHLALFSVAAIWGANGTLLKVALRSVPVLTFASVRYLLSGLVMIGALRLASGPLRLPRPFHLVVGLGLLVALNQILFGYSIHLGSAVDMSLIMGLTPALATGMMAVAGGRWPPGRQLFGLAIGFLGVLLVVLAGGGLSGNMVGDLVGLGAPASWALYMVILGTRFQAASTAQLIAWTTLVAAAFSLPLGIPVWARQGADWGPALLPLLYGVLFASALAFTAQGWGIRRIGVTPAAIYMYLQPLLGVMVAAIAIHERVYPLDVVGGAMILLAAFLGTWRREEAATIEMVGAEAE